MGRKLLLLLLVAAGGGGWYAYTRYTLDIQRDKDGAVESIHLVRRPDANGQPAANFLPAIRIASFNLDGLDENKLANRQVADVLVRVIPQFQVVALQGVRGKVRGVLNRLIEQINATGRSYDLAIGEDSDRESADSHNAFLFDKTAIEVNRLMVHAVFDPTSQFRCKPLVGAFRVRGPAGPDAFTFTLLNVCVDPNRAAAELDLLAGVYRAVRDKNPNEDDIILLGDLETDPDHLGQLGKVPDLTPAITGKPTVVRGNRAADNLLFNRRFTLEFTGRAEVFDLMRQCDLSLQDVMQVTEHMPVWAEFTAQENGTPGHVGFGQQGN